MIYAHSLQEASKDGFHIIDIREPDEILRRPLDCADEEVPMEALLHYPERFLNPEQKVLLVCAKGLRAQHSTQYLRGIGYEQVYAYPNAW